MTMLRAVAYLPPGHGRKIWDVSVLRHDERRVRRRAIPLAHGDEVLVDFPAPVSMQQHGALELSDGRCVEIIASEEELYAVRGRDAEHLMELCWHIGNRHAKAQIEGGDDGRIVILREPVLRDMLVGLGATVTEVSEPFGPLEGAYHSHAHGEGEHALLYRK